MFGKEGTMRAFAANNEEGEYVEDMGSWESSGRDAG